MIVMRHTCACSCVHARAYVGRRVCARVRTRVGVGRASLSCASFAARLPMISFCGLVLGKNLLPMVITAMKVIKKMKYWEFCSHLASISLPANTMRRVRKLV